MSKPNSRPTIVDLEPLEQPCADCGAEAGEECRPYCTGEAAYLDQLAQYRDTVARVWERAS